MYLVLSALSSSPHQLLAYADDVNILGGSIHNLKENAEALVAAIRELYINYLNFQGSISLPEDSVLWPTNNKLQFAFRGPRIVIYSYNKNQEDVLFLNFTKIKLRNSSSCWLLL